MMVVVIAVNSNSKYFLKALSDPQRKTLPFGKVRVSKLLLKT